MIVKGEIATRQDMNGEFTPTENTDLLINFKQIPQNYTQETISIAEERTSFPAYGYPRSFLDGIDESKKTLSNDLNSSSGFSVEGIFQTKYVTDLFESSTKVGNLALGNLVSSSNIPNDSGTSRSISIFFKPIASDLMNIATIFTQRISVNRGYHIGLSNGRLYSRCYNSSGVAIWDTYITDEILSISTWHHVIISHTSTNLKIFVDGLLRKDFTISGIPDYVRPYKIGNMLSDGYSFNGLIRSLSIFSYNITEAQGISFGTTYKNNYRAIPINASINTTGTWAYTWDNTNGYKNDNIIYSNTANDTFELTYYGNKIDLYMRQYLSAGTCNIYIDDLFIEQLDNYALTDSIELVGTYEQITKTDHKIKIEVVSGYSVIDYFNIYDVNYIVGIHGNELHLDQYADYLIKEFDYPTGYPRFNIDDIDELGRFFYRNMDGTDEDFLLTNGASLKDTTLLFGMKRKVLDLSIGGYAYTNNVPVSDGGTQRAFGCWFKPSNDDINGAYGSIASQRSTTSRGYHLGINAINNIYIRVYDSAGSTLINYDPTVSVVLLEANKWYLVVLVHDATNWTIYINGASLTNGTFTGTPDYTTNFFKFGRALTSNSFPFYGQVASCFLDSMTGGLWNITDIENYWNNAFDTIRNLPTMAKQTLNGNWDYEQKTVLIKALISNSLNDEMIIEFTAQEIEIFGYLQPNGGNLDYYIDDVYVGTVSTYASSNTFDLFIDITYDQPESHTLKIVNVSDSEVWFTEFWSYEGKNILYDESKKENNCTINYLVKLGEKEFRDNITLSKYEFALDSINTDYPSITNVECPDSIFSNIGDKWFMGGIIKPKVHTSDLGILIFNNTVGSDNTFFRLGYYQDHATVNDDVIRLYGDFIDEYIYIGEMLSTDKYYFFGVLVDDTTSEIWYIIFNMSDQEIVKTDTLSFITSTTYPRENLNTAYLNYGINSSFSMGIYDSFIFEGNTEHTTATILEMLYSLSYATGADNDTPNDVVTIYSNTPKLELRKDSVNKYIDYGEGYYFSKAIYTGKLDGSGKINISKDIPLGTSITGVYTRTCDDIITDSPVWSAWEEVSDIGIIASPNRNYIQLSFIMFSNNDRTLSPSVTNMQVLDIDPVPYTRKAFSYPITYDINGNKEAIIDDCTNLHQIKEINGADFITFDLPYNSIKREYITPEKYIRLFDEYYITRNMKIVKNNGRTFLRVYAEAIFYNLGKGVPLLASDFTDIKASDVINYILASSGWEIGECDITIVRDFSIDEGSNQLEQLRKVQSIFGGDLIFDNDKKQVSLLNQSTIDNGVIFAYKKNMENIEKEIDSTELANRVYCYGEDGLTIADQNNGIDYVKNDISSYVPSNDIFCKVIDIPDISSSEILLSYAYFVKDEYKEPKISYSLTAKDLSVIENLDLSYNLGDTVTCFDEELDIQILTRIIAVDYNILVPNESTITLSNKIRNLGDEISELKKQQQKLSKLNWSTFIKLIKFYLQNKVRKIGWINKNYVKLYGNAVIGAIGVVSLSNIKSYLNVRSGYSLMESIIAFKHHGDSIIIIEISPDGNWYKINL